LTHRVWEWFCQTSPWMRTALRWHLQCNTEVHLLITFCATQLKFIMPAPFARTLSNTGLAKWVLLCDVMLIKYFSDAGTQMLQPFFGWCEEMYGEFITNMYDSLMRYEVTKFEHHKLVEPLIQNTLTYTNFRGDPYQGQGEEECHQDYQGSQCPHQFPLHGGHATNGEFHEANGLFIY
jgi:hypothetical protein